MSIRTISFLFSLVFSYLLLFILSVFFINTSIHYYIQTKKEEIISHSKVIKNTFENNEVMFLSKNYVNRDYLFNIGLNLPDYVYFIMFDSNYEVILFFPYYFTVDEEFLKIVKYGQEKLIINSKNFLITYFLPINIKEKEYMLAVEMDLSLIKEYRNKLNRFIIYSTPLYLVISLMFAFFLSKVIQARLNKIRDFSVKVALGNLKYELDYPYKDELQDVFKSIKIMKNNLINQIEEINSLKRLAEKSKEKLQNILQNLPFTVLLIEKNPIDSNIIVFNNHYLLPIEFIKQTCEKEIIDYQDKKFKILRINITEGTLVIFVDFTEIYEIEKLKIKFLSEISHDLRTPLTIIKSIISTLIDEENLTEEQKAKIKKPIKYIDKISEMIKKYLNYSKIKLRKIAINKTKIQVQDLLALIEDIIMFFNSNIEITKQISKSNNEEINFLEKTVEIDIDLFQQMMFNIIDNASKKSENIKIEVIFLENNLILSIQNEATYEDYQIVKNVIQGIKEIKGLGLNIIKEISLIHNIPIQVMYQENFLTIQLKIDYVSDTI